MKIRGRKRAADATPGIVKAVDSPYHATCFPTTPDRGTEPMASRPWRALTIVLVLASASPPPRVTNALIAASDRHDPANSNPGKSFQSRARNRIGSTIHVAPLRAISGLASGRDRLARSPHSFARIFDLAPSIRLPFASPTSHAAYRLRC
jgi:hypothetical protein